MYYKKCSDDIKEIDKTEQYRNDIIDLMNR